MWILFDSPPGHQNKYNKKQGLENFLKSLFLLYTIIDLKRHYEDNKAISENLQIKAVFVGALILRTD